jgi:hypothetical protein
MIADGERRIVRNELLDVITVFMVVASLRCGFCFGFFGRFIFPVHVRKRNGSVRPATIAQFFYRLWRVVTGARIKQKTARRLSVTADC